MRRNTAALISVLAIVVAIVGLDVLGALLPVLTPGTTVEEHQGVLAILSDHSGQLLILLTALATAAITIRQQGGHFFDDDDKGKPDE